MNQVDDDLHRVLQLARAQSRLHATKASRGRGHKPKASSARHAAERHRHNNSNAPHRLYSQPSSTLLNAKLKGMAALNGLENAIPRLSDCSKTAIRHAQQAVPRRKEKDALVQDEEAKLAARRALYKRHYSGLQAPYAPRGLPKLECLLDAAQQAKAKMARHSALPLGASVLTSGNRIYVSCTIESVQHDAKFTLCAERAAIMKALGEDPDEVVTAMAICSDQKDTLLPFPCGTCREFMAGCGDFPVFLVNGESMSEETRSFALFPRARQTQTADVAQQGAHTDQQLRSSKAPTSTRAGVDDTCRRKSKLENNDDNDEENVPIEVSEWCCEHVLRWVAKDVELPQYRDVFARNGVDGCMLLHFQDCDLQLLLGIVQPLHRKRLLVHIDRLKDRALLEHGVDYGQLQDYLAVLDRDRIAVVAQLKATFDRLDQNHDGLLDFYEVKHALRRLGCDASAQAVETLLRGKILHGGDDNSTNVSDKGNVSFVQFATAFSSLAMQPASEDRHQQQPQRWRVPDVDVDGLRGTFAKADRDNSGRIDAQELVGLFRSLEKTKSVDDEALAEKARTWLREADGDGDSRLSFAEFLVRYLQLTKTHDLSKLQGFFEGIEPVNATYYKPMSVLRRALETFFPEFSLPEISVWYKRHLNSSLLRAIAPEAEPDSSDAANKSIAYEPSGKANKDEQQIATASTTISKPRTLTISFADFVLAVFLFQEHTRERQKNERVLHTTMSNNALAHKSRIVHLQQSGHVRMCPQSTASLAEMRRQQQQTCANSPRSRRDEAENEGKHDSTDDEQKESDDDDRKKTRRKLASQLARVDDTFDRFAKAKMSALKTKISRRQHSESDDDEVSLCELNALEAVQAMTELGISCSRAQMLRLLKDEGFGLHNCIDRRDFRRLFHHFHAQCQAVSSGKVPSNRCRPTGFSSIRFEHETTMSHMKERLRGEYGKHRNRQDYDEYLVRERKMKDDKLSLGQMKRKPWTSEMARYVDEKQRSRRQAKSTAKEEESKDASNSSCSESEMSSRGGRAGARRSSRRISRSRSRHRSSSRRTVRRKAPVSSTASSTSSASVSSSNETTTDSEFDVERHGCHRRHSHRHNPAARQQRQRKQKQYGFEIGDRIVCGTERSHGTIIRLYQEYFVADIHFDNGKNMKNVDLAKLRHVDPLDEHGTRPPKQPPPLRVGVRVAVMHKGTKTTRKGTIVRCRMDNTFDVQVNEIGEQDTLVRVPAKHLRVVTPPMVFAQGASVKVKQRHEYVRGKVHTCCANGTYDIQVRKDKSLLKRIEGELLSLDDDDDDNGYSENDDDGGTTKSTIATKSSSRHRSDSDDEGKQEHEEDEAKYDDFEPEFAVGDHIEARFQGKDAYYSGKIMRVRTNGTYDVVYDDGDEEAHVKSHFIKSATSCNLKSSSNNQQKQKKMEDEYADDGFESD